MHRVLFDFGQIQVSCYGVALAFSVLLGIGLAVRRANRFGIGPQQILDLSIIIVLASAVGSRAVYVVFHLEEYASLLEILAFWRGGATFYGGFLLASAASYWWARQHRLDFLTLADIMAPSIAMGLIITRVGCLLNGCCFGRPTDRAWGLVFPPESPAGAAAAAMAARMGLERVALHPTQVYSSLKGLVIFVALLALQPGLRRRGATFGLFLALYGTGRFILDFFRFYEERARLLGGLTFTQVLSVGLLAAGLTLLLPAERPVARPAP